MLMQEGGREILSNVSSEVKSRKKSSLPTLYLFNTLPSGSQIRREGADILCLIHFLTSLFFGGWASIFIHGDAPKALGLFSY
jgi:hypothetical protein